MTVQNLRKRRPVTAVVRLATYRVIVPTKLLEALAASIGVAREDTLVVVVEEEEVRNATNAAKSGISRATVLKVEPEDMAEVTRLEGMVVVVATLVDVEVGQEAKPVTLVADMDTCRVIVLKVRSATTVSDAPRFLSRCCAHFSQAAKSDT